MGGKTATKARTNKNGAAVKLYVPPKKVTKAVEELEELEAEKLQIEAALRRLKTQKVQNMINDTASDYDDYSDDEENSSSSEEESASYFSQHNSDVSSLHSRANTEVSELEGLSDGNESVMTEDVYHYDVRGRRQTDDNLYNFDESGTALACYQQTGYNGNDNTPLAKRPKTSGNEAPVVIEWSRGRTYVPQANVGNNDEIYYHHPTEVSLMVADDKSFYDDLSFSSGDDSKLAAAVTDMPMEIDFDLSNTKDGNNNDDGDDDVSFASGLHSDCDGCSISIMAPPPVATTAGETSSSSSSKMKKRLTRSKSGEIAFNTAAPNHHDNRNKNPLYVRDESSEENSRQTDAVQTTNAVSPSSKRDINNKVARGKGDILNMEVSPPREEKETDLSVLSSDISAKPTTLQANTHTHQGPGSKLPTQISCSDLSVESLGSELCGVSVHQHQQQQQQQDPQERITSTGAQHTRTNPATTPTSPKGSSDKPAKSNKSNSKPKKPTAQAADSEELEVDDELSAEDMAVIRKRQEEMLQLDSGDERPLQNISKRKKRRSIDATTGGQIITNATATTTSANNKPVRKKRTQKRTKNSGTSSNKQPTSSSNNKPIISNTKEESRSKKKSDSNK